MPVTCHSASAPKHTSRLLETSGLSQGENKTGTKVLDGVDSRDWLPSDSCDGGATLYAIVSQSTGRALASSSRLLQRSSKSRGSAKSVPTRGIGVTADLYNDDICSSMLVKNAVGAGSPVARRCALVGHLRNAINTAAVIQLFVSICAKYAGVSVNAVRNQ